MKKTFRILAVVLAATMLMCCCAFAIEKRSVDYGCYCGTTSSNAYTETTDAVSYISASFSGSVHTTGGGWVSVGASCDDYNDNSVSCSDYYGNADQGYIYSSHSAGGSTYHDSDSL